MAKMAKTVPWVHRVLGVYRGHVDPWAHAVPMVVTERMAFQEARATVAISERPDLEDLKDRRGLADLKARWAHLAKMQSCAMKRVSIASRPRSRARHSSSSRAVII